MHNRQGNPPSIEVVNPVDIEFVMEELLRSIAVGRLKDREEEIESIAEKSCDLIEPRAVYTLIRVVGIQGDGVLLEGDHALKSIVLGDILTLRQEVAPYVVTIGSKLEDEASRLGRSMSSGNSSWKGWGTTL